MNLKSVLLTVLMIQSVSAGHLVRKAGMKVGVASSTLLNYTSIRNDVARVIGVDGGVFVEWCDMPVFSLLTELHLLQKGGAFVRRGTLESGATPAEVYLSLPVLGKLRVTAYPVTPFVILGPRIDFLFGESARRAIDMGVTVGIGIEIPTNSDVELGLEFRFSPGFRSVFTPPHGTVRNSSMEFLLVVAP